MRGLMFLVLSLIFMSVTLLGCQSENSNTLDAEKNNIEQQSADNEIYKYEGEIAYISISKLEGDYITTFDDAGTIETIKNIILSAAKEKGIVNMASPEFNMNVVYENKSKQRFYLWIGEKGEKSALMKPDDTHTIYTVSEEMTSKLIDLIE